MKNENWICSLTVYTKELWGLCPLPDCEENIAMFSIVYLLTQKYA